MEARKAIYYGLGHLAYAVAMADGAVQADEKARLEQIVVEEALKLNFEADVSEIIFQILDQEKMDVETTFVWGMDELQKGKSALTPEIIEGFVQILEKVAASFPPTTPEEQAVIDRFKREVADI